MTPETSNKLSDTTHKRLSVQISLTGLSFLVTDAHTGRPLLMEEHVYDNLQTPESLLMLLQKKLTGPMSPAGFESVSVMYANGEYTVVPTSLFDETKASDYLKFNNRILAHDFVAVDHLNQLQLSVVYIPLVNINNYLFETFGSFKYYHSVTVLLENLKSMRSLKDEVQVQLHVLNGHFDLIAWKKDKLLMCNSFSYTTPEDFIYYVLFSFEQLSLDPDQVDVVLMGTIKEESELYQILYRYVRNLEFLTTDSRFEEFDNIPSHAQPALKLL